MQEHIRYPFIYGAQYYRAPTPDRKYWRGDLTRMVDSGFNAVKFWCQWRWAHRGRELYYFDDIEELMDIAREAGLAVTINVILDVAPSWVLHAYPGCLMVTASGQQVQPRAVAYRQIGGYPGPCFNHPEARAARQEFLRQTVSRFAGHPAMGMWDVWNEPESCAVFREPNESTLVCYCQNCQAKFRDWLNTRYGQIERLNEVWGRCYGDWRDVELPRERDTFIDMVDWRMFNLGTLAVEARWRLDTVKAMDSTHPVYLHPVPNVMSAFNPVTCVDDFQISEGCDCFAGSTNGIPASTLQTVASARGRVTYNAECHMRAGSTSMYPRPLSLRSVADNLIPQIGLGIRGFLYWQYRPETIGSESPAWGLLDVDGQLGVTHKAAAAFWKKLQPVAGKLASAAVEPAEAAILRSSAGEIFHWCMYGNFDGAGASLEAYARLLYERNVRLTFVSEKMLVTGLPSSIRLLVLPIGYALTQDVADTLKSWVSLGGTLLCEAHTGGYSLTTGRHSGRLPGLGLSEAFGFHECNATAANHLPSSEAEGPRQDLPADLAKAMAAFGWKGGTGVCINLECGLSLNGVHRYAELEGENLESLAALSGHRPCVARASVGDGWVYYLGMLAGQACCQGDSLGLGWIVDEAIRSADIRQSETRWPGVPEGIRVDALKCVDGIAYALSNRTANRVELTLDCVELGRGLFTNQYGDKLALEAGQADLMVPVRWIGG